MTDSVFSSRDELLLQTPGLTLRGREEDESEVFTGFLLRNHKSNQSIYKRCSINNLELNVVQPLDSNRADRCTNQTWTRTLLLSAPPLFFSSHFLLFSFTYSPSSRLSPCYLSTRPWRLSLRSVAPSVALGWWMGWWTLGRHGNLMDGLATDTSGERARTQIRSNMLSSQRMWVLDFEINRPQTVTTPPITNTADPWLQRHICPIISSLLLTTPPWWSETAESRRKDNSRSVNVNKTKEMIVDFRRTRAWTESQRGQRAAPPPEHATRHRVRSFTLLNSGGRRHGAQKNLLIELPEHNLNISQVANCLWLSWGWTLFGFWLNKASFIRQQGQNATSVRLHVHTRKTVFITCMHAERKHSCVLLTQTASHPKPTATHLLSSREKLVEIQMNEVQH